MSGSGEGSSSTNYQSASWNGGGRTGTKTRTPGENLFSEGAMTCFAEPERSSPRKMPGLANGRRIGISKNLLKISMGTSANALQDSSFKSLFFGKNRFNQEKSVQFSGL
jgi:hypothetical protein